MKNIKVQNDYLFLELLKEVCQDSKILESEQYKQHGSTSVLLHSILVAYFSFSLANKFHISVDEKSLIRGALLHDYFLYDWHVKDSRHGLHGFTHPYTALRNATRDLALNEVEKDIIVKHMFPLTLPLPKYKESIIVCIVDKLCSLYETFYLDSFIKLYAYHLKRTGALRVVGM